MRELDHWKFEVLYGEIVPIRVVAYQTDMQFVQVWIDGQSLTPANDSNDSRQYSFQVEQEPGQSHILLFAWNFPESAHDSSRYELRIGSDTSYVFLRTVNKTAAGTHVIIEFVVADMATAGLRKGAEPPEERPLRGTEHFGGGSIEPPKREGWAQAKPPMAGAEHGGECGGEDEYYPYRPEMTPMLGPEDGVDVQPETSPMLGTAEEEEPAPQRRRGSKKRSKAKRRWNAEEQSERQESDNQASLPVKDAKAQPADKSIVNVGFASQEKPDDPFTTNTPLLPGQKYFFWLQIGELIKKSLEAAHPVPLNTKLLPKEALLKVVLFPFKGELGLDPSAVIGELKMQGDGSAEVIRQPFTSKELSNTSSLLDCRLFFPIKTPKSEGVYNLRCNIYCEQVGVQSRLIRAHVMRRKGTLRNALKSTVDYTLTHKINPEHLSGLGAHQLSLMLNGNGDGTVDLRFFGEKEFTNNASFDGQELQSLITDGREALRKATWGDTEPWNENKQYRYSQPASLDQLRKDLAMLAKRGYAFYDHVVDKLSGGRAKSDELAALMRKPGRVQIALKESARHFIPSALIYDYSLDTGLADGDYKICPSFQKAFAAKVPLDNADCFNGLCPTTDDLSVICPSGFWGFRHYVGMPLSITTAGDAPPEILWQGARHLTMAAATSLDFKDAHHQELLGLGGGLKWDYTESRDEALRLMKQASPHLIYFYCHGGMDGKEPYIRVGPSKGPMLKESLLRATRIQWNEPRPLVFINGCHTTALEPEQALEFVSSFVTVANAAGVIGTEITVFESLARAFASNFLKSFIVDGKSIGESIRSARLALLKSGNPLGLVYLPFVIGTLRMLERSAVQPAAQSAIVGRT